MDGNRRLAWLAAVVLLDIDGQVVDLAEDEAFQLVMDAAEGAVDVEEIAARLLPGA